MKKCSLWCICSFQFLIHLLRNKGQKSEQHKILTLCISLKFISSHQMVIIWLIPVTKPFTWPACQIQVWFPNLGALPVSLHRDQVTTERHISWKKSVEIALGGRLCFLYYNILFFRRQKREGEDPYLLHVIFTSSYFGVC